MESSSPANAHVPSAAKQIAAKISTVKSRPSRPMFQTRFSRYHSSSPPYASRNRLLFLGVPNLTRAGDLCGCVIHSL